MGGAGRPPPGVGRSSVGNPPGVGGSGLPRRGAGGWGSPTGGAYRRGSGDRPYGGGGSNVCGVGSTPTDARMGVGGIVCPRPEDSRRGVRVSDDSGYLEWWNVSHWIVGAYGGNHENYRHSRTPVSSLVSGVISDAIIPGPIIPPGVERMPVDRLWISTRTNTRTKEMLASRLTMAESMLYCVRRRNSRHRRGAFPFFYNPLRDSPP